MKAHRPEDSPQKGNHSPYIVGAPSAAHVKQNPPKEGETAMDDLGVTWGEVHPGITVGHN
ncbi:MAG: hypothetical protein RIB80_11140 [Rhodospirillales bacterium]